MIILNNIEMDLEDHQQTKYLINEIDGPNIDHLISDPESE
jgi:hypothetical protein